jgi:hypothetical protein
MKTSDCGCVWRGMRFDSAVQIGLHLSGRRGSIGRDSAGRKRSTGRRITAGSDETTEYGL